MIFRIAVPLSFALLWAVLLRLLSFLDHAGSRYPVGVLDGSDPAIQEMNVDAVRRFAFARHEAYAVESHLGMRCADALTRTRTPYMVFCADDDFGFPAALAESENITTDIAARDIDLYLTQWAPPGWSSPHLASRPLTRARKLGMGLRLMESIFHPAALAARHGLPLATVSCLLRAQRAFVRDDARRPPASTG